MTPTALFVYNRPQNLQRTLDCLKNNKINLLYVFSDGPKSESDEEKIEEVRKILDQIDWVETEKFYQEKNIGLSESVIFGVNKVFEKYDTIICIEDDVCVANGFYEYMNACLEKYRDNPEIAGVTGLKYPIKEKSFENYNYDIFFYLRFSSWGWGTWKKAWQKNIFNQDILLKKIEEVDKKIVESCSDMVSMYNSLRDGKLSGGWDVYCSLNIVVNNQYFIYPTKNMIENTGMSKGTHASSGNQGYELKWSANINSGKIRFPDQVTLNKEIKKGMDDFFGSFRNKNGMTKLKNYLGFLLSKFSKIKQKIFNRKPNRRPDPSEYSTCDNPQKVPCQMAAYNLALDNYLKGGDSCLDVGFGQGYGLETLSKKAKKLAGIDVDKKAVKRGVEIFKPQNIDIRSYNGYDIPFENSTFDLVTCIDVIEHVEDYNKLIKEMLRVSKNGVFISTPNRRPEYTNPDGTPRNRWHLREWSFDEFNEIVRSHGEVDWNFFNGPFEGPFTCSKTVQQNTLTLSPFIYNFNFKDTYVQ
jgi:2-polyprenyl-3-methyl-5-hydroxy-6-metoxy-1,4-benzoquinol methylase